MNAALPPDICCAADYEPHARRRLDANAWAYFHSHAGHGLTVRANRAAWDALALLPRVLRKLATVDSGCQLLGRRWPLPLLAAPMALQRMAHPDGELGLALAAAAQGAGTILSCQASQPLEQVAAAVLPEAGRGPLWFQLYPLADRGATLELVRRVEAAGFEALVLTVDSSVRAARAAEMRAGYRPPPGITTVNLPPAPPATSLEALLARSPSWDDVDWLQQQSRLPVLLKGILHPADARQAAGLQVGGLIVSNHGGRTLDGAAATARALPRVVQAVDGQLPVLVDGGIQRGTDILKALALGANAVLVGRPLLWGLAAAGAQGVAHVLRLLRDELAVAMAQCGAGTLAELTPELLLADPLP